MDARDFLKEVPYTILELVAKILALYRRFMIKLKVLKTKLLQGEADFNFYLREEKRINFILQNCLAVIGTRYVVGNAEVCKKLESLVAELEEGLCLIEKLLADEKKPPVPPRKPLQLQVVGENLENAPSDQTSVPEAILGKLKSGHSHEKDVLEKLELESLKDTISVLKSHAESMAWPKEELGSCQEENLFQEHVRKLFPKYGRNSAFCKGAIFLQNNPLRSISAITTTAEDGHALRCKFCFLEFPGNRQRMENGDQGISYDEYQWTCIARCHMQASSSLKNLSAWYMCRLCYDWNHSPPQIFLSPTSLRAHLDSHGDIRQPSLHETPGENEAKNTPRHKQADEWFTTLHNWTSSQVLGDPGATLPAVRIAIIDSGIELPDAHDWSIGNRIVDHKSWVEGVGDLTRGDKDILGHGTHGSALILKVAPDPIARLYVARVFAGKNERKRSAHPELVKKIHQRIADAITWATEEWQVDIISMSFGYDEPVAIIEKAIEKASLAKIIMFASASNTGGNSGVAWPARSHYVISIFASDCEGNRCTFTPNPIENERNFSTIGKDVESSWPSHLEQGEYVRRDGTSSSTPVAAGIAALVLYLVKVWESSQQNLPEPEREILSRLHTVQGMKLAFSLMAQKRDNYDYLAPWFLWNDLRRGTICDNILGRLRHH